MAYMGKRYRLITETTPDNLSSGRVYDCKGWDNVNNLPIICDDNHKAIVIRLDGSWEQVKNHPY